MAEIVPIRETAIQKINQSTKHVFCLLRVIEFPQVIFNFYLKFW